MGDLALVFERSKHKFRLDSFVTIEPNEKEQVKDTFDGVLTIGGTNQAMILRVEVPSIPFSQINRRRYGSCFAELEAACRDFELQLHVSSLHLNSEAVAEQYLNEVERNKQFRNAGQSQYLSWYARYTDNYFRLIQQRDNISRTECRLIVSRKASKSSDSTEKEQEDQRNEIKDQVSLLQQVLARWGLRAYIEKKMTYSCIFRESLVEEGQQNTPEREIEVHNRYIKFNGHYCCGFTMCLSEDNDHCLEWLDWLLSSSLQFTVSIRIKPAGKIQLLLSVTASSRIKLLGACDELKQQFNRFGIVLAGNNNQLDFWLASLPLGCARGYEPNGTAPNSTLSNYWPFFKTSGGSETGFWLGQNSKSQEPTFFYPMDSERILVTGSGEEFHLVYKLLLMRTLCTHSVLWMGTKDNISTICDVLGEPTEISLNPDRDGMSNHAIDSGVLSVISKEIRPEEDSSVLNVVKVYLGSRKGVKTAIFLPKGLSIKKSETWSEIFRICDKNSTSIIVQMDKKEMPLNKESSKTLLQNSTTQLFSCNRKVLLASRYGESVTLKQRNLAVDSVDILCLIKTKKSAGLIEAVIHPLDNWLFCTDVLAEAKRVETKEEVRCQSQGLCNTDIARQAIYQLVMSGTIPYDDDNVRGS